jgi:cellulose synthase/poly-beta-1,6-N-acetylglucosamine synthase-like glycosyltransferase
MQFVTLPARESSLRLEASVHGLAERAPTLSAQALLSRSQKCTLGGLAFVAAGCVILWPRAAVITFAAVVTALYLCTVLYRFWLFLRSARADVVLKVSDEEARALSDGELPVYTVLVPALQEPEVIGLLLRNVESLEYPRDLLDVKILVESGDEATIAALRADGDRFDFEVVIVPYAEPQTKPKALNYGLGLARGEFVTIYDVEDEPDPLQLRRAIVAYSRADTDVGCVQAKLSYHNPKQNLITRWFTIEYAMWFSFFLPGLAASRAPIPLGGTSNHFPLVVLRALGAWDPFNVTEDADLGVRMSRAGYRVAVLESTTREEANSDFVNWMRQRSRWYKGYLQTFAVHLRSPRRVRSEIGWRAVAHFCLFVGGTPVLALLNPVFWVMSILWFSGHPAWLHEVFPAPVYYAGLLCWVFGNFVFWYLTIVSCRLVRRGELLWAALIIPLYWVMMSMAAYKALWQLAWAPSLWEKTAHGLTGRVSLSEPDERPGLRPVA